MRLDSWSVRVSKSMFFRIGREEISEIVDLFRREEVWFAIPPKIAENGKIIIIVIKIRQSIAENGFGNLFFTSLS